MKGECKRRGQLIMADKRYTKTKLVEGKVVHYFKCTECHGQIEMKEGK